MFQLYNIVIYNIKAYTPLTVIKNNVYIHCAVQYICRFFILVFVPLNPLALSCPLFPVSTGLLSISVSLFLFYYIHQFDVLFRIHK